MNFLSSLDDSLEHPFDPASLGADPALVFQDAEPGDDQRWSTWPATLPSERGPLPRPDWVVTSAAAIDTELGVVKTGKEADLHLIERAVPGSPHAGPDAVGQRVLLAAKRYRGSEHSDFHRSAIYTEGRGTRRSRDARAVKAGTTFGREVARVQWASAEFEALSRLWQLGASVPYPVQVSQTEVLMEFVGDGRVAAPRLAQVRADAPALRDLFHQVVDFMRILARAGLAHGDLSPYNALVDDGRLVVIDLPQVIDLIANPSGFDLLHRDCVNMCTWFTRQRLECDAEELFGELVGEIGGW
ncbi:serine/threonine protein kinase [Agromyces sp. CFH 90414]|uniref:non-specific serine/threonine protein kinase n=1 Tax=Agromyces agglutinans TaxID=2662258 RepID=A0A6I2F8N7_9MICO|nr:RIO1 family regulatory kinase/ATPase [Agromyces agglutinans]MRG59090.1 serine/threonine protein kinase [Agromyces agglutinans]